MPPSGPRPPDDICTLLRSPPDFLRVSLSLLWCLGPNQDTSVLLFSHPFGAPPFSPWSPEDICTLFSSLLSSPHPQGFFGLSGPFGISLIPVTIPLVPSEPFPQPSLCSRAVCFSSYSMFLFGIQYPEDVSHQLRSPLEFFREGNVLHLFLRTHLPWWFLLCFAICFCSSYLGVD